MFYLLLAEILELTASTMLCDRELTLRVGLTHQSARGPDNLFLCAFSTIFKSLLVVVSARERLSTSLVSFDERLGEWSTKILQGKANSKI